jgi:hypothetical protein
MTISRYVLNQKHRIAQPTNVASVWRVSDWQEIALCAEAAMKEWKCGKGALWNASEQVGSTEHRLGEDTNGDLWVSKFVSDNNDEWHGYPVRPVQTDIPPAATIEAWCEVGRISIVNARRMQKGQLR